MERNWGAGNLNRAPLREVRRPEKAPTADLHFKMTGLATIRKAVTSRHRSSIRRIFADDGLS